MLAVKIFIIEIIKEHQKELVFEFDLWYNNISSRQATGNRVHTVW